METGPATPRLYLKLNGRCTCRLNQHNVKSKVSKLEADGIKADMRPDSE